MGTCAPIPVTEGSELSPECIPSEAIGAVPGKCGVFVASFGTDDNDGSKLSPVATLSRAIEIITISQKPIYVCAESFDEALTIPAGAAIFGGLDCVAGWTWSPKSRTTLTAPPDQIPIKLLAGGSTTRLENLLVAAADSFAPGGSSIAGIIDNQTAELRRCELHAGSASDGSDGLPPNAALPTPGSNGMVGTDACTSTALVMGGAEGMSVCDNGMSAGGKGGTGGLPGNNNGFGQAGANGQPSNATTGMGGAGESNSKCSVGGKGNEGAPGDDGKGGVGLGEISIAGYMGAHGEPGSTGKPGQGGGGGGGAKAGLFCGMPASNGAGASGGGGGSGGCGGKGGEGGQAGGSSIALILLNAAVIFEDVTLTTKSGGRGGNGSYGQPGGTAGQGGKGGGSSGLAGSNPGCTGGEGGDGGYGGFGGGGRGGHSIGIAYTGSSPVTSGVLISTGTPGQGGHSSLPDITVGNATWGITSTAPINFP